MSFEEMQSILQGILVSQQRSEERMQRSEEWMQRSEEWMQRSEEWMQRSEERMQQSEERMQQSEERMQRIEATVERIEATVERAAQTAERAAQVADSNGRAIQAMLDNAATDRLQHEERTRQHEERMARLESISQGLVNLSTSIDVDRPAILRLLNSNNNKLDALLERFDRLPPQQS